MPKFYFHIRDDAGLIAGNEGMEFADLKAARKEAEESARELLADALRTHKEVDGKRIEIADAGGSVLETIKVWDMLN
jgi:hypothetical protein